MSANHPMRILIEGAGYQVRAYRESGVQREAYLAVTVEVGGSGELVGDLVQEFASGFLRGEPYDAELVADAFRGMRVAQLGKGEIVYFRGVPFRTNGGG